MNVLGSLFRLICSWLILLVLAVYIQSPAYVSPANFVEYFNTDTLLPLVSTLNWVTITAGILLILAVLRIQEIIWNVAYAAAFILFVGFALCSFMDPATALPTAIESNRAVLDFCALPQSYPIPAIIITAIFAMGWLCSTAPFRIMFTCALSVALWYGCTEVFQYMVGMWAKSPNPTMPELLHAIQSAPWIIAAIPGAFFVVYALLTSFIETFISRREEKRRKKDEKKAAESTVVEELEETQAEPTSETKPAKPTPSKPIKKPAPAAVAPKLTVKKAENKPEEAPKAEEKPVEKAKEEPKSDEKPAEGVKAEPKAEEKPAEEAKAEPKVEEKPAAEAQAEPKVEEKPAEEAKAETKAEEKPAEEAKAETKAEEKPAEEAKAEEKPANAEK